MDANNYRTELLLVAAARLAKSHGVFFAAALLADLGVPLSAALRALSGSWDRHRQRRDRAAIECFEGADEL